MSKQELEIMIDLNKKNKDSRTKYYLKTKDEKQKTRLLKSIIRTNQELIKLKKMMKTVA